MWSSWQLQVHCQPLYGEIIGVIIRLLSWSCLYLTLVHCGWRNSNENNSLTRLRSRFILTWLHWLTWDMYCYFQSQIVMTYAVIYPLHFDLCNDWLYESLATMGMTYMWECHLCQVLAQVWALGRSPYMGYIYSLYSSCLEYRGCGCHPISFWCFIFYYWSCLRLGFCVVLANSSLNVKIWTCLDIVTVNGDEGGLVKFSPYMLRDNSFQPNFHR